MITCFLRYTSLTTLLLSVLMLVPGIYCAVQGIVSAAWTFVLCAGLVAFLSVAALIAGRKERQEFSRLRVSDVLPTLCGIWLIVPAVASFPINVILSQSLFDIYFQSLASLTSTGGWYLLEPGFLTNAMALWLGLLSWFGGFLTIAGIILILAPMDIGGLRTVVGSAIGSRSVMTFDHVQKTFLEVLLPYIVFTFIAFILIWAGGVDGLGSILLSLNGLATADSLPPHLDPHQISAFSTVALCIAMLLGGSSAVWLFGWKNSRWNRIVKKPVDLPQIALLSVFVFVLIVLVTREYYDPASESVFDYLKHSLLNAVSLVTTSGFSSKDQNLIILNSAVILPFALVGGAAIGTSGGIKMFRVLSMAQYFYLNLLSLIYPHAKTNMVRESSFIVPPSQISSIWTCFGLFIAAFTIGMVFLSLQLPLTGAMMSSLAAIIGNHSIYDSFIRVESDWISWAELNRFSQGSLMVLMWMGRLEVVAVFGAAYRLTLFR